MLGFSVVLPLGNVCELDGLFVDPGHWRRGIGCALMEDAFAFGRAGGAWMMEVTASPQAEDFYARLGFERSGLVTKASELLAKCAVPCATLDRYVQATLHPRLPRPPEKAVRLAP